MNKKIIAFLTDFGNKDGYVSQLKGTILKYYQNIIFVDISNEIEPFNIEEGRFILYNTYKSFPKGTIFFVVIDPGVGTDRKILFIKSQGYYFLGPDNGVFDYACGEDKSMVHTLKENRFSTFQARDIMAVFLGNFLQNKVDLIFRKHVFPKLNVITNPKNISKYKIIYTDHYGNMITNINNSVSLRKLIYKNQELYTIKNYNEKNSTHRLIKGSHGFWEICGL